MEPIDINNETNYEKFGVYKIFLFDKNDNPVKICRFGGIDEKGVLMIGHSTNINNRRKQFISSSSSKGRHGHSEGIQWWLVNNFSKLEEKSSLKFSFVKYKSEEEAIRVEKQEIKNYLMKYWEAPPLNGVIPGRVKWFDELRARRLGP